MLDYGYIQARREIILVMIQSSILLPVYVHTREASPSQERLESSWFRGPWC